MAKRRKHRHTDKAPAYDPHAEMLANSVSEAIAIITNLPAGDQLRSLNVRIDELTSDLLNLVAKANPLRLVEQVRLAVLPWHSGQPVYQGGLENGFSLVEFVAIAAFKSNWTEDEGSVEPAALVDEVLNISNMLYTLHNLKFTLEPPEPDPLRYIRATLQASEVHVRATSYPELAEATSRELFTPTGIDHQVKEKLGFGYDDAFRVLTALHSMQVEQRNRRQNYSAKYLSEVQDGYNAGIADDQDLKRAQGVMFRALNPGVASCTVAPADVAREVQISEEVTREILRHFSWVPNGRLTAKEEIENFFRGANPLRIRQVLTTMSGRFMIVHPAQIQVAIREGLELELRATTAWEFYQKHRGEVLERRTKCALEKVLANPDARHAMLYYVPASLEEEKLGPESYTKRVEADHLILVGDVAIAVEDKAVALSAHARSGGDRLQKDLAGLITKAAEQAQRLVDRIATDKGLRVHGEGWLDLSNIREIHTIAVSLEDLTSTSTATAELMQAGVIGTEAIPWTVSLHDLDLTAEIMTHPADFLLYLRRRCNSLATVLYTASDELDLLLYYFEAGLYVEEDPALVRRTFPNMPKVTDRELSAWRAQKPGFVTSRTDQLDAWYYGDFLRQKNGKSRLLSAPVKPGRGPRPVDSLVAALDSLQVDGRLSIQSTLLSLSLDTQRRYRNWGEMWFEVLESLGECGP